MTEAATATTKPDQQRDAVDNDKRDVDRPRNETQAEIPEEQADRQDNEVIRPVWVEPHQVRAHRPFFVERSTRAMVLLPRIRAGIETVVVTRGCAPAVLGTRGAPSRWSMFWQDGTLYEIDLGLHHTAFDVELPSAVDMFSFRADVAVEWRVLDPVRVVKDHVADVREALRPALASLLALDTRRFRVDEAYDAERQVAAALHHNDIGLDYGLSTTIRVRLSADPGAAEHAASRRALQQKIEIDGLRHDHRKLREANEERVIRGRMQLYREIISAGDVDQFALQLAKNPEGIETVVRMVRDVRKEDHRHVTDFLTRLIESGAVDRWEVKDTVQTALDWLKENNDRVVQTGHASIPWQRGATPHERNGTSFVK
jgi:hypothetical protein